MVGRPAFASVSRWPQFCAGAPSVACAASRQQGPMLGSLGLGCLGCRPPVLRSPACSATFCWVELGAAFARSPCCPCCPFCAAWLISVPCSLPHHGSSRLRRSPASSSSSHPPTGHRASHPRHHCLLLHARAVAIRLALILLVFVSVDPEVLWLVSLPLVGR